MSAGVGAARVGGGQNDDVVAGSRIRVVWVGGGAAIAIAKIPGITNSANRSV